jgi:urea transport system permease protein
VVNAVKTYFTVAYPEAWLLILGGLFVIVTLFLPKGIIGLLDNITHGKKTVEPSVNNMETKKES